MKKTSFLLGFLFLLISFTGFAQRSKNKVTVEMLKKEQSEIDPGAAAEILEDKLYQHVDYEGVSGNFYLIKERFVRVKVYDKDRFDGGTIFY